MRRRIALTLFVLASAARAATVTEAYQRLYNFDFTGAHRALDAYQAAAPQDPLGHSTRAAAYLFYELDRLKILQGEFFSDDKKISGDDALLPDPAVRSRFFAAIDEAQRLAEARLKEQPRDTNAMFAYSMTEGLRTDYTAFVEKRQLRSLSSARKAHSYAVQLLQLDPTFVDAKVTTGITEYLSGSLPFFIRWFIKFENTQGSKEVAVANLENAAGKARYLGPFARILLAIIHLREKRAPRSLQYLEGLVAEFPQNPLLRREMERLRVRLPQLRPR
ncbi:MAG: hypothetical protein IT162_06235 [Bryobacterales bacterium]|nr:hypothetical protein [Bryobacterales bacterium]